jgi:hypothetical protein
VTAEHGNSRYSLGCRCDVCREGRRVYQRDFRSRAKVRRDLAQAAGQSYVAAGITHGLYGYQRHVCRCFTCRLANSQAVARQRAGRAAR